MAGLLQRLVEKQREEERKKQIVLPTARELSDEAKKRLAKSEAFRSGALKYGSTDMTPSEGIQDEKKTSALKYIGRAELTGAAQAIADFESAATLRGRVASDKLVDSIINTPVKKTAAREQKDAVAELQRERERAKVFSDDDDAWDKLKAELAAQNKEDRRKKLTQLTAPEQKARESYNRMNEKLYEDSKHQSKAVQKAGSIARSIGYMAPSMAIGGAYGGANAIGTAAMAMQSGGGGYEEARSEGAAAENALRYAIGKGLLTFGTEKAMGAIPGLGKGELDDAVETLTGKLSNPWMQYLARRGIDRAGESLEEVAEEFLTPYLKRATYDANAETASGRDLLEAAGSGFVISSILGAPADITGARAAMQGSRTQRAGSEIQMMGNDTLRAVIDEGLRSGRDTDSFRRATALQDKIDRGELLTENEIGELYYANQNAIAEDQAMARRDRQDRIKYSLEKLKTNETPRTILPTATEMAARTEPQYRIKTIPGTNKQYVKADRQVVRGDDSSKWEKQIENYINDKVRKGEDVDILTPDGDVLTLTERTAYKMSDRHSNRKNADGTKELLTDSEYRLKGTAAGHIDELTKVSKYKRSRTDKDGKHKNDFAEDGFDYREAYFMDADGSYYRMMISAGKNADGKVVYNIGQMQKRNAPSVNGSSSSLISEERGAPPAAVKQQANEGRISFDDSISQTSKNVNADMPSVTEQQQYLPTATEIAARKYGTTARESGTEVGANETAIRMAERLSFAFDRDVVFYNKPATEAGTEGGYYQDGKIHINVAGRDPMIQIFSHELTHSTESSDLYDNLKSYVLKQIDNFDAKSKAKIEEYRKNGVELSKSDAEHELVAEYAAKNLFANEQEIYEMALQQPKLAQRVQTWIDTALSKLGNGAASDRIVLNNARALYADALDSVAESKRQYSITPNEDGGVVLPTAEELAAQDDVNTEVDNVNENVDNDELLKQQNEYMSDLKTQAEKFGRIKPGEKPAREVVFPKTPEKGKKNPLTARTVVESAILPDASETTNAILKEIVDGNVAYTPKSNKVTDRNAHAWVRNRGFNDALDSWREDINEGKTGDDVVARGAVLLNNAINAGDSKRALDIFMDYVDTLRTAGRAVQAARILKQLSPSAKLYAAQRTVNKLNQNSKSKGKKGYKVEQADNVLYDAAETSLEEVSNIYDAAAEEKDNGKQANTSKHVDKIKTLAGKSTEKTEQGEPKEIQINDTQIKKVLKNIGVTLSEISKMSAKDKVNIRDEIVNKLIDKCEMDSETSNRIAEVVEQHFTEMVAETSYKKLKSIFGEKKIGTPKTFAEKLMEYGNLGAFNSDEFASRASEKLFGVPDYTLSQELAEKFLAAESDAERDAVLDEIYDDIASQMPTTLEEYFTALRYTAMLGNLKTQVRNITGNLGMQAQRIVKDRLAATMELTMKKADRTKAFVTDPKLYKLAAKDFEQFQDEAMGNKKYNDYRGALNEVRQRKDPFHINQEWKKADGLRKAINVGGKALSAWRKVTNWAMENGDLVFSKFTYADALSGYLKAKGITAEQFASGNVDEALLDQARVYAISEAQKATFRDNNQISEAVSAIGFREENTTAKKIINATLKGVLPFRKTPANVMVRAIEYSPLGLIDAAVKSVKKLRGSNVSGSEIANSLAQSLTGTGLFVLGLLLSQSGILRGREDEDENRAAYDDLIGRQSYSIELPDGTSFTIDWATPASIPLFMGAELAQNGLENGFQLKDLIDVATSVTAPLMDMSMMSGLSDMFENVSYSDDPLRDAVINALTSYMTQGLSPTILGQIERSAEDVRMTTYVDKNSQIPDDLQYLVGKVSSKIPGWDYQQIPYINAWGETEESAGAVEQFVSPAYTSKVEMTHIETELQDLYDRTGESTVLPKRIKNYLTIAGEKVHLTADQYTEYAVSKGQYQKAALEKLMATAEWRNMNDKEKISAVREIYDDANLAAKKDVFGAEITLKSYNKDVYAKAQELYKQGVSYDDYYDMYFEMKEAEAQNKGYQKSNAIRNIIASAPISENAKKTVYRDKISDSRDDDIEAFDDAGLSFNQYLIVQNKYAEINETVDGASNKALELARWVEQQGFDEDEAATIKQSFMYYSQIPAQTDKYDAMMGLDIEDESAAEVLGAIAALKPLEGKKSVSDKQKYQAIMNTNLTYNEKLRAFEVYMGESAYEKLNEAVDNGIDMEDYITYVIDTADIKADKDASGKTISGSKKTKILDYINSMPISSSQKDTLYLMAGYSDKSLDETPWYGKTSSGSIFSSRGGSATFGNRSSSSGFASRSTGNGFADRSSSTGFASRSTNSGFGSRSSNTSFNR